MEVNRKDDSGVGGGFSRTGSLLHSIGIREELCIGCTECLKTCPTEAIRLRNSRAIILEERCIDCGMCIRVCPVSAAVARTNSLLDIEGFRHKIALVGPEIYGQFGDDLHPELILQAIMNLGFDEVHDITMACEEEIVEIRKYISSPDVKKPVISFSCPSVARLVRARFPSVLEHLVPLRSPMGAAAQYLRETRSKQLEIRQEETGLFYITPCPARMTRIRRPLTDRKLYYSGAISLADIYGAILAGIRRLRDEEPEYPPQFLASGLGLCWGAAGGEAKSLKMDDCLYVDGMANVLKIFYEIERGELSRLNYLEVMACPEGCVGGPLMVENVFLARNKIQKLARLSLDSEVTFQKRNVQHIQKPDYYRLEGNIRPHLIDPLDVDPTVAIKKIKERDLILDKLPGIDCGVCGAPRCQTLADDIVQGTARRTDCIFVLFDQANDIVKQVNKWISRLPVAVRMTAEDQEQKSTSLEELQKGSP